MTREIEESLIAVAAMKAQARCIEDGVQFASISFDMGFTAGYQAALPEWQDICTAPKDRDILAYCLKSGEQFVVWWGEQVETGHGGWVAFRNADGLCVLIKDLSHWQPLPSPPKDTEQ